MSVSACKSSKDALAKLDVLYPPLLGIYINSLAGPPSFAQISTLFSTFKHSKHTVTV